MIFNTADYRDATGSITVTLSSESSVTGDVSVGTDTLIGIDRVFGSGFDDTFTVDSTFSATFGSFNEIEGGGGDDVITGNGKTRVGYLKADAGVFVDLGAGTARGLDEGDAANVGTDTFTGVRDVRGSQFGDTLVGGDGSGFESFRGQAAMISSTAVPVTLTEQITGTRQTVCLLICRLVLHRTGLVARIRS